ncbi:hypothetical protein ABGB18_14795 [Nonomuraea sp. B12E4]|uniref:hypothetical protein n=1 Tax=Nonomuraea sp. B12E4 TaxID=3153564 RepID=UPI00325D9A2D
MNEKTTPSRGARPGIRVTPGLLGGAMAVLVLMVFTIAFLLTRGTPVESAAAPTTTRAPQPGTADSPSATEVPSAHPSASEPVPSGPAKFSKDVDPCTLVGEDVLAKLVLAPRKTKIYVEECEWATYGGLAQRYPENMGFTLKVYLKVFPGGVAEAHEQLLARRYEATAVSRAYTRADPAIGDDSYVTAYTSPGGATAIAGVRLSNAVIEARYDRKVTEDPEGRLTKGALEVAQEVAGKLSTSG